MVSNTHENNSSDDNLDHSRLSKGLSVFLNWLDFESSTALLWEDKTKPYSIPIILTCSRIMLELRILISSNFHILFSRGLTDVNKDMFLLFIF